MPYTRDHFQLQLQFAHLITTKFSLDLEQFLKNYTTFTMSFGEGDEWREYIAGLAMAEDATDWTYAFYLPRQGEEPTPETKVFNGHPLFGCFYYAIRDGHIVRTHFVRNDTLEPGPLSKERLSVRKVELAMMFAHIQRNVPEADTVLGNSWLYNLEAYRRLFPPEYTEAMEVSDVNEFRYMARWGQFFDKYGRAKEALVKEFFHRLRNVERLDDIRDCFPYQILRPQCSIERFFAFYDIR